MRGGGHSNYQPDKQRQNAYRESLAQQREFSFDEIITALPVDLAQHADLFQINELRTSTMPTQPWPPTWRDEHPEAAEVLAFNIALYDDALEGALYEDQTMQELMALREHDQSDEVLSQTIRARRTVLVSLILHDLNTYLQNDIPA